MRLGMWAVVLVLGGALAGCDGGDGDGDAGPDGGHDPSDSGTTDPHDSGVTQDGGGGACGSTTLPGIGYEDVVPGFDWRSDCPNPAGGGTGPCALVGVVQPQGSTDLYVIDQRGYVFIVRDGALLPTPFLDLTDRVVSSDTYNELGLLGLAFHPDYESNGRLFVYYTEDGSGGTYPFHDVLVELHYDGSTPDVADTTEVQRLLDIPDPQWNHNGGQLAFGPDGYLYAGVGDGGNGYDQGTGHDPTTGNGQSTAVGLGKIHRVDVDDPTGDHAPANNPFVAGGGLPTIWAYGLRNPWRFSFDRSTGDLWIADVGQDQWEEIDVQPASSAGGENYGWAAYEGTHLVAENSFPLPSERVDPVLEYSHMTGGRSTDPFHGFVCAVVGGYVYRGSAIAGLQGWYLFGDYCNADVIATKRCDGAIVGTQVIPQLQGLVASLTSFGQDQAGELYLVGSQSLVRLTAP